MSAFAYEVYALQSERHLGAGLWPNVAKSDHEEVIARVYAEWQELVPGVEIHVEQIDEATYHAKLGRHSDEAITEWYEAWRDGS